MRPAERKATRPIRSAGEEPPHHRVLGDDHPDTLWSVRGLAARLRDLGDYQAARDLDEDTLARRRRILSDDHPDTQRSARNLATDVRSLDVS
jgi:hypothetical protein